MSQIPMEYNVMKKKLYKTVAKNLGDDIAAIIVYGSSASERVFSGISDIDFLFLLQPVAKLSKPLSEVYESLSQSVTEFLENPLFNSLFDYDIYLMDQVPTSATMNGFSPIRALAISEGELLHGNNPFEGLKISKDQLRDGARRMVQELLDKLTSLMFMANMDIEGEEGEEPMDNSSMQAAEKEFLAVDAILSSAQAYHMYLKGKYVNMPDVVLFGETEPIDGIDNELIAKAGLLRQGVETQIDDLYNKGINFCATILEKLGE